MSYTTTNMFAPRIWGFDFSTPEARVARQSGWSWADILWENLMEQALHAWIDGDRTRARRSLGRAAWITGLFFAKDDLRRATVLVNQGIVAQAKGQTLRAKKRFSRALAQWDACAEAAVEDMQIAPRARSSLFHLRMEARHRTTYHDNMRLRFRKIATEVRDALEALSEGNSAGCRLFSRWRGEKPNVFDDTRKFLGACLLIIDVVPEQIGRN